RKLLTAVPDSALAYRPQPNLWSVAELASHIAEVYNWYPGTFEHDHLKMEDYQYDKGDIGKAANILQKFEENVKQARTSLDSAKDEDMMTTWRMTMEGKELFPPMPRIQVVRGFLMNHLYHHRGEMISHLRATGNTVPGLYGPTYEEMQAR
ncbi:MAG: DinB family protein, partial [Marinirhabdus sp.]